MGHSPRACIEGIYEKYLHSHSKDTLRDPIIKFRGFLESIQRNEHEILQEFGVSPQLTRAQTVAEPIKCLISALEEILCYSMTGFETLTEMYNTEQLIYQSWE